MTINGFHHIPLLPWFEEPPFLSGGSPQRVEKKEEAAHSWGECIVNIVVLASAPIAAGLVALALFGQDAPSIPSLPNIGTVSATAILAWWAWYTQTKQIPSMMEKFEQQLAAERAAGEKRADNWAAMLGQERQEYRRRDAERDQQWEKYRATMERAIDHLQGIDKTGGA